jgi:hypothetical protein
MQVTDQTQHDGLGALVSYSGSQEETYRLLEEEECEERRRLGKTEVEDRDAGDYVEIKLLRRIDAFVDAIQACHDPAFSVEIDEKGRPKLRRGELAKYFGLLSRYYPPRIRAGYGERAKLFYEVLEELALENGRARSLWAINEHGQPWWRAFNDFVELARERALRGSIREAMRRACEMSRYQGRLLNEHLDQTLSCCAKLCVVRLDFGLQAHVYRDAGATVALAELRKEFGRFLNNRRHNKIFKHLVSYAWKAERARQDFCV